MALVWITVGIIGAIFTVIGTPIAIAGVYECRARRKGQTR